MESHKQISKNIQQQQLTNKQKVSKQVNKQTKNKQLIFLHLLFQTDRSIYVLSFISIITLICCLLFSLLCR